MDNTVEQLQQRIAELEKQLSSLSTQQQRPNIDQKEMETFRKVSAQLGYDWIEECGINECQPLPRFRGPRWGGLIPMPKRCIYECSCGPCNYFDIRDLGMLNALERFRSLGF